MHNKQQGLLLQFCFNVLFNNSKEAVETLICSIKPVCSCSYVINNLTLTNSSNAGLHIRHSTDKDKISRNFMDESCTKNVFDLLSLIVNGTVQKGSCIFMSPDPKPSYEIILLKVERNVRYLKIDPRSSLKKI